MYAHATILSTAEGAVEMPISHFEVMRLYLSEQGSSSSRLCEYCRLQVGRGEVVKSVNSWAARSYRDHTRSREAPLPDKNEVNLCCQRQESQSHTNATNYLNSPSWREAPYLCRKRDDGDNTMIVGSKPGVQHWHAFRRFIYVSTVADSQQFIMNGPRTLTKRVGPDERYRL